MALLILHSAHTVNLAAHDFIKAECQLNADDYQESRHIVDIPCIKIIGEDGLTAFAPDDEEFDAPAAIEDDQADVDEPFESDDDEGDSRCSRQKHDASPLGLVSHLLLHGSEVVQLLIG